MGIGIGDHPGQLNLEMAKGREELVFKQQADQQDGTATREAAQPQDGPGNALGLEETIEP